MIAIENVLICAPKLVGSIAHFPYSDRLHALDTYTGIQKGKSLRYLYKILHKIEKVNKNKFFTLLEYTATRGHSLKLFKRRSRLKIRANSYSNRVIDSLNGLAEQVVQILP